MSVFFLTNLFLLQGRGELFPSRRGEEWQQMKHSFQLGQFGFMASSGFINVVKVFFLLFDELIPTKNLTPFWNNRE